jgi:hypothetical protein
MLEECVQEGFTSIDPCFWKENVSLKYGKHNLPSKIWETVCKIRNRPIITSQGFFGYILDHPDAITISDEDKRQILSRDSETFPALVFCYEKIVFLREGDFEIIPPFRDKWLAICVEKEMEKRNAGKEE